MLWLMSKTTQLPTLSEFFQLCFTSRKCAQSALLATLYQANEDASHSGCSLLASRIFFRLMTPTRKIFAYCEVAAKGLRSRIAM